MIQMPDGSTAYTRNGHFTMAVNGTGYQLSTAEGYAVLDSEGNPITFDGTTDVTKLSFDNYGRIMLRGADNNPHLTGLLLEQLSLITLPVLIRSGIVIFRQQRPLVMPVSRGRTQR